MGPNKFRSSLFMLAIIITFMSRVVAPVALACPVVLPGNQVGGWLIAIILSIVMHR